MMNNLPSQVTTDTERKKSKVDNKCDDFVGALPREIAELIAQMLDVVDYHRFSAVCKTWRSIAVAAKQNQQLYLQQLPWLMLSSNKRSGDDRCGFFSLFHGKLLKLKLPEVRGCRCCGSSWGWLIMANEIGDNFLLNPFSRLQIQLPSQTTLASSSLLFLDLRHGEHWFLDPSYIRKAMLLTPPEMSSTASSTSGNGLNSVALNCITVAIYETKKLCFCKPGDWGWTDLTGHLGSTGLKEYCIEDIVLFNNQLYAVTTGYYLMLIELEPHPKCTKVRMPWPEGLDCMSCDDADLIYLVECCGELLMVVRHRNLLRGIPMSTFKVFKLDLSGPRWNKVESLGDEMLFVGKTSGMSLSASRFSGFRGNGIYFTDGKFPDIFPSPATWPDLGVFSLLDILKEMVQRLVVYDKSEFTTNLLSFFFEPEVGQVQEPVLDDGSIKSFFPTEFGTKFLSTVSPPVWYMPSQF